MSEQAALKAYPELQRLIDMKAAGWVFQVVSQGGLVQVKGMQLWRIAGFTWGDLIQIRDITDAAAIRVNPNKELVWRFEGDMPGAIDALLELPHPGEPNAPHLVIGTLGGLWSP